jgi:hypothetical protein
MKHLLTVIFWLLWALPQHACIWHGIFKRYEGCWEGGFWICDFCVKELTMRDAIRQRRQDERLAWFNQKIDFAKRRSLTS